MNINISRIIKESLNDYIQYGCFFRIDETSKRNLKSDSRYINEDDNSWILKSKNWDVNDYDRFLDIVEKTPGDLKGFLTQHGEKEISSDSWVTYTLKGADVAFALHYVEPGVVEICNLVNNSDLKGIGPQVLQFAKMQGGTDMDNYRGLNGEPGKLGSLYRSQGFDKQTWHDEFNPEFQPDDPKWRLNTEKWGTPDVEGLRRSKHAMRYGQAYRPYKKKYDDRIKKKFNQE
jgi:hypothetical protein